MTSRFRSSLSYLLLLIAFSAGWTQQSPQVPPYRSKTEVVLVPVLVRTKTGPAEGLKSEHFSCGERQATENRLGGIDYDGNQREATRSAGRILE
jgi:hypothetical protein